MSALIYEIQHLVIPSSWMDSARESIVSSDSSNRPVWVLAMCPGLSLALRGTFPCVSGPGQAAAVGRALLGSVWLLGPSVVGLGVRWGGNACDFKLKECDLD